MSLSKLKLDKAELRREVRRQATSYIIAAFSLVAGLAWNDAIKSLIEHFFPPSNGTLFAKFFYAAIITLLVVVVSIYFVRLGKSDESTTETKN